MRKSPLGLLALIVVVIVIMAAILVAFKANQNSQEISINFKSEGWTQENISFQANSEPKRSDLTYLWDFGDGQNGSGGFLNHSYRAAGNYSVTLSASDPNGSKFSSSSQISIKASERLVASSSGRWNKSSSEMDGKFFANLTVTNIGPSPIEVPNNLTIKSYQYSDGSQYIYPAIKQEGVTSTLSPGQNASWTSFFDLPQNRTPLSVIYDGWLEAKLPFLSLGNLSVSFIDVGQGDSILIETPEKLHVLIDAGDEAADTKVTRFLTSRSITTIDAFILTHPDSDHIGGADEVLQQFNVLSIYHPGILKDTTACDNFIAAARSEACPLLTDDQLNVGDLLSLNSTVRFQVMSINAHASSSNDASIVLKMTYGTVDFLFTGDIDTSVESSMMGNSAINLDVEILKVSHHGSKYATSTSFLSAVSPQTAVVSVGAGNDYGHPAPETIQRLRNDGVAIYRTDLNGTVTITSNGQQWSISTLR